MKISLNWLKQYIDLPKNVTAEKLVQDLTMATVEVEGVINQSQQFEKMVIGKVIKLKKHPNADKLKIAMTNIGQKNLVQIVCGGVNLKKGMLVAVALSGAKVRWHGKGEPVVLEKAKIRGQESFGMICSSNEIGLENIFPCSGEEIADLSAVKNIKPGQPLAQAMGLDDVIFEIDNKSMTNRPDLWSHYGIARELAVIYKIKLKELKLKELRIKNQELRDLKIEVQNKDLCSRYIGCLVENIKVEKSPEWLVKRLEAVGLRAINNIVDITNYVMLDVGEPTHAFDVASLHADKRGWQRGLTRIIVRNADRGEKIQTLDSEIRELNESMLVIANEKKPVALAGIMGGAESEINENTKSIVLEAANFDAISIRKTSQKLNHRTESSIRFEKNLDPNLAETAMLKMLKLIKEICPGAKIDTLVNVNYHKPKIAKINIEHNFIEKKIGQKFNQEEIIGILERLGFKIKNQGLFLARPRKSRIKNQEDKKDILYKIEVPSWRATGDVFIPEDIVEEIVRIYGYDNLKSNIEMVELSKPKYQLGFELEKKIKNYLSLGCGMNEVFNYPWAEERHLKRLGKYGKMIELENPPTEENRYLQPSLIPNLIKNIEDNLRYFDEFKIFELARVFTVGTRHGVFLSEQPKMLAGAVVVGRNEDVFLIIKGIVEGMKLELRIMNYELRFLNKNKSLDIMSGKEKIGWMGEMKDMIKNKNIGLFEINIDKLVGTGRDLSAQTKYQPLPQYPSIERDIAIEVGWNVKWQDIKAALEKIDDLVYNIEFLSEYDLGDPPTGEAGKKSLAFRVTYQADRTLKDEEVEVVEKRIIKMLEKKFGAELRK